VPVCCLPGIIENVNDPWIGSLVRLRAFETGDGEAFAAYFNDGIGARLRGDKVAPYPTEAVRAFVDEQATLAPTGDQVRLLVDVGGAMVGSLRTFDVDPHNGRFSFHVSIVAEHRRRGYAADAATIILGWYFDELRYHKCVQQVYSFNSASIALHKRLGFSQEGSLTEAVFANGSHHDEILFGMTENEYRALRP
jgi:RimJ/RimL family protein N-acetyltransferase